MSDTETQGRPTWPFDPLYKFLHATLPAWRTPSGILDVNRVADEIGISSQAVYKWFHLGKIPSMTRARKLHAMASTRGNIEALEDADEAPELVKFIEFVD